MNPFERDGYSVIRSLLTEKEITEYRQQIQRLSGICDTDYKNKVFACPDGVSRNREFWPLIYSDRLVSEVEKLSGRSVRYTQHSDLHAHRTGGWHRDCACRQFGVGPDWDEREEPYQVVRVAIYLQSYEESGSALGVVPGSHRYEKALSDREWKIWLRRTRGSLFNRISRQIQGLPLVDIPPRRMTMWTKPAQDIATDEPTQPVWIPTGPGDCVIFDQRLYHSASNIFGPKYAIYLSYSPENRHSRNHMGYYRHIRTDLGYSELEPELIERLKQRGLYMDAPPPDKVDRFFANGLQRIDAK
ncbi:phytanoyl-CoA dioxygenase family protein [Blastopirellula marina]|uniref:Phytanoyl-CoA dioxygenase family protein n=1 Tax=Blastopirellula marina DSM 3645 TaxID=314230 RepID=A3ZPE0_9BACT|nr:phytanoyl-CoA dioxygenase family protein [Blastopirellula marina]EAQ81618.1 hypothetical protein DSM3645_28592 [Blastopirellula marina DSM 3645]